MSESEYTQEKYDKSFPAGDKREKALEHALDIRKFEIELYWKRAAYFWTFIGATFAGFVAVQSVGIDNKQDLSVILSCLGMVFSVAWVCVNRGSKHWQENWEKHVDMLEDEVTGPLYKVILTSNDPKSHFEKTKHLITGSTPFSVSKINQIISLYVLVLWVCLLMYSLPEFNTSSGCNTLYSVVIGISIITCILFFILGRSNISNEYNLYKAAIRKTGL